MTDDVVRQTPLPDTLDIIRETLLAPLPTNMHVRRDAFGCEIRQQRQTKPDNANRSAR